MASSLSPFALCPSIRVRLVLRACPMLRRRAGGVNGKMVFHQHVDGGLLWLWYVVSRASGSQATSRLPQLGCLTAASSFLESLYPSAS
jgi:hypothetical protein